jgi:DNA-binding MarR family transcriptional regulator
MINSTERKVLMMLAGCPTGATEHNLVSNHKIKRTTLYDLVQRGLIHPTERRIRPPYNFKIIWLSITPAGREALK